MKKIAASLLLAVGIVSVGVAAPATAAPVASGSNLNVIAPLIYWPR